MAEPPPPVIAPGNVAVITGGASGIGLAAVEALVARGMKVVLADIDEEGLRDVTARLSEDGGDVTGMVCDTSDAASVGEIAERTLSTYGAAHLLFNNAGIAGVGDAWGGPLDLWDRVIGINLMGVVHGIRAFLPIMDDQGSGHVVSTASMAGLVAVPGIAPYNATKHGVVAISEGLFIEMQATGSPIGVSVLCPGFVRTGLMRHEPGAPDTPIGALMSEMLGTGVDGGIPATDVADAVVSAVDERRFWILTHPESRMAPVQRMQRAADGVNPPMFGQG